MASSKHNFSAVLRAYLQLTVSAVLIAVFLASLIQGIIVQASGSFYAALLLYLVAWLCLGSGTVLFLHGRKLLHLILVSA